MQGSDLAITSSSLATSTSCTSCKGLDLTICDLPEGSTQPSTKEIKAWLFHEPCRHCDEPEATKYVTLCDHCRHFRIHHLLVCHGRNYKDRIVPFKSERDFTIAVFLGSCRTPKNLCDCCTFLRAGRVGLWGATFPRENFLRSRSDGAWELASSIFDQRVIRVGTFGNQSFYVRPYIKWRSLRKQLARRESQRWKPELDFALTFNQEPITIRVVDVLHRCIVFLPPNTAYYALSYVWGTEKESGFRCELSNIHLERPGGLTNAILPQTILDAMHACQQLGQRFLWVDRFCIVQNDPNISVQLNQMALIYHRAALTIVATGPGASYGLPGKSIARKTKGSMIKYNDNLELVHEIPNLDEYLWGTLWAHRGWTYQEQAASSRLLYFTEYGVYYYSQESKVESMYTEGAAKTDGYRLTHNIEYGLRMIAIFSERQLSYISDKLRAVSGILNAMYGDQTYCGMPYVDFDVAMLWEDSGNAHLIPAPMFPTWSWLASPGAVEFPTDRLMYGLAHWGRPGNSQCNGSLPSRWEPIYRGDRDRRHPRRNYDNWAGVGAAMAWLHACSSANIPEWLILDCPRDSYINRLKTNWHPDDPWHWNTLLEDEKSHLDFANSGYRKFVAAGRIVTHAQPLFPLNWCRTGVCG